MANSPGGGIGGRNGALQLSFNAGAPDFQAIRARA